MLIAAYAGCGKSTAAQKLEPDVLDLPSMIYRWLLPQVDPDRSAGPEMEREKGALHHIADPRFPYNYVLDILREERAGKTVLFPTIVPVINMLAERYGREVLVVCPEDGLKEEYRRRFTERGNSDSFLELFAEEWSKRLEAIGKSKGRHLRLRSGEYLLSVLRTYRSGCPAPDPVSDSELAGLEREIEERGRDRVLWMPGHFPGFFACPVEDLDSPEVRRLLDAVGMAAYERGLYQPLLLSRESARRFAEGLERVAWFDRLEELHQAVRELPEDGF